ncbi:MAG: hypothetical protein VX347_02885 [Bacteroidota bacterium]|nr:hypothetical protein [Bacteroidota bacterium]
MEEVKLHKKGNKKLIIFVVLGLISVVFFFFQKQKKIQKEVALKVQFIEEKNMLRDELDDLIEEHDGLLDEYGNLNEQLGYKDSIIQNQISEIRNLIRSKNDLVAARQKIESLKEISKRYLADIDSLFIVNKNLTTEKDSVIKVNKDINWKNYKLNQQNKQLSEKVDQGSILEISDVSIEALRYRSTGREVSTRSAKKTQNLRTCFRISANQIAESGVKEVYFQYINPYGEVLLNNDSISIVIDNQDFLCSSRLEIQYNNIETESCLDWERRDVLVSGVYHLNIIIDKNIVGQTAFELK